MVRYLGETDTLESRVLGEGYPYWWRATDGRIAWSAFPDEAIAAIPVEHRELDPVAVLSMLSFGYICHNRTLIKGLSRSPWFGRLDASGTIERLPVPPHGHQHAEPPQLARQLLEALRTEQAQRCQGHSRIWLLLSGGMDSRVIAGVLHALQHAGEISCDIHAVTWGLEESRDVVYARQMAALLGWTWHHLPLTADDCWQNFERCAAWLAAECSPMHLHRMDWFSQLPADAVVLAGSYGDSIGRAEFSSRHLSKIPPLAPRDPFGLLQQAAATPLTAQLRQDILAVRTPDEARSEIGWCEVEQMAHYMRRLITNVLCVINRWGSMQQAFVTPDVFSLVWAHAPECRTDAVYAHLLQQLDPRLLEIPWARTGVAYQGTGEPDTYRKRFHQYGLWMRRDHREKIEHLLFDSGLEHLHLFDMQQVRWMFKEWLREPQSAHTTLCTQMSWLATLALLIQRYQLQPPSEFRNGKVHASFFTPTKLVSRVVQTTRRLSAPLRGRTGG